MTSKLCKSCSGPLDEFKKEDLVNPDFCPYCVDKKGNLKCYDDILKGMITYIKSDHPEITLKNQKITAEKWLNDGLVWGNLFKGIIIEESLENKEVLDYCDIKSSKIEHDNNPKTNAGELCWTLHHVEVKRSNLDKVINLLSKDLRLPNWWADLSYKNEIFIIFRNQVFKGNKKDKLFVKQVQEYGRKVRLPESQIPLSS